MDIKRMTLAYPLRRRGNGRQVGLGRKVRKYFAGKYMGSGGVVGPGESPVDATIRELSEEWRIRVKPSYGLPVALLDSPHPDAEEPYMFRVFVSVFCSWVGTMTMSEEMEDPEWFPCSDPPLAKMPVGDRDWFPLVMAGKTLYAQIWYDGRMEQLLQKTHVTPLSREELSRLWATP